MFKKLFTIKINFGTFSDGSPKQKYFEVQSENPVEAIALVKSILKINDSDFISVDNGFELLVPDETV